MLARQPALPLLCVGDAASCFDPVSGQGIVKALRSGIFASYAVADLLVPRRRERRRALSLVRDVGVLPPTGTTLRDYYALEQRWPDRPFWQRRCGDDQPHEPHGSSLRAEAMRL